MTHIITNQANLVVNHEFSVMEILWTFSIYLESVAILPQLFMVSKTGELETITSRYLVTRLLPRPVCTSSTGSACTTSRASTLRLHLSDWRGLLD